MNETITLAHGNGGRLMHELIERIRRAMPNAILDQLSDAAFLKLSGGRALFSTDSYVIQPLFFPGGDIGKLAVFGTVNDLAVAGARPLYLSLAFIIEEGLPMEIFDRVIASVRNAARQAKVIVVTGDIKVVERGAADKMFINTAGIGIPVRKNARPFRAARRGDHIVINGSIAEHGIAILNERGGLGFSSKIRSDCRNVNDEVARCLGVSSRISIMRDPTRGGVATTLNEIARSSGVGIEIDERMIPIRKEVRALCDILGLDPLYIANEGKFICFVNDRDVGRVSKAIGRQAAVIGRVTAQHPGQVYLRTPLETLRLLPLLEVDQLPRIC